MESLIDDLGADIDDALERGLTAEDRDVLGARVADLSAEIDQLEQSAGEEGVAHLRRFLDSVDYKLVQAERARPELTAVDSPSASPQSPDAPSIEI